MHITQVASKIEFSSCCIPCVLIRTINAISIPKQHQLPPPPVLVERKTNGKGLRFLTQSSREGKSRVNRRRLTSRRTAVSIKSCFSR
ncbi:hypothetical protein O181_013928, partial [Austropuccinia psidii MF-1]|nr:hypothetical protein [Austropuccinia psidii MF-1]